MSTNEVNVLKFYIKNNRYEYTLPWIYHKPRESKLWLRLNYLCIPVKLYWNIATLTHFRISCGHFRTTLAELSSWNRKHKAHEA